MRRVAIFPEADHAGIEHFVIMFMQRCKHMRMDLFLGRGRPRLTQVRAQRDASIKKLQQVIAAASPTAKIAAMRDDAFFN